jgi:mono/diheme cytochrome c family protein
MKQIAAFSIAFLALSASSAFAADATAGHADYDKSCKSCHGATGAPNAAIAKMLSVTMRDLSSPEVQALSDADLKKDITDGKGKMKPMKTVPSDDVVAYMRTFKK